MTDKVFSSPPVNAVCKSVEAVLALARRDGALDLVRVSHRSIGVLLAALLVLFTSIRTLHAQDAAGDNPTGVDGDYNGDVTTGGRYDPFTGNAKRVVTDLTVPGSNGAYPLAFTRTRNSQAGDPLFATDAVFGDSTEWRHSYQWTILAKEVNPPGAPNAGAICAYDVEYPDGSLITFRPSVNTSGYSYGRTNIPQAEGFWRGPAGTTDRLEVRVSNSVFWLHTSDGGIVKIGGMSAGIGAMIVDPYGAVTTLSYGRVITNSDGSPDNNSPLGLTRITEPGGRYLSLYYTKWVSGSYPNTRTRYWLTSVQASNHQSGNDQKVIFDYTDVPQGGTSSAQHMFTGVEYPSEGSSVNASYSYNPAAGVAFKAIDPHYAGAMSQIQYVCSASTGFLQEEDNANGGGLVSRLSTITNANNVKNCTETRGDHDINGASIARQFIYGQTTTSAYSGGTGAETSQLNEVIDFQGVPSYLQYFGSDQVNGNGQGYIESTTDKCGYVTAYTREPILGRVTSTKFSGHSDPSITGTLSTSVWTNVDDDTSNAIYPYFLHSTTNERGQTTTYWHDWGSHSNNATNSGMVSQIAYPDGSHEYFWYQPFPGNGNTTFYKLSIQQDQLGAQVYYYYDDANHGGSGHLGLLTRMTRYYADGYGNTPGETTNIYYDAYDRVSQTVAPRSVTEYYTYNGRHQLASVLHGADNTAILYGYDTFGRCTAVEDELQHTTYTTLDEYGRPTSVQVPVNSGGITTRTTQYTYDGRGLNNQLIASSLSHTDARFSYQVLPSGRGVQHLYSQNGWLTDEYTGLTTGSPGTDGSLAFSQSIHDKQNIVHDAMGRQGTVTDAQGHTWTTPCDGRSRPLGSSDPLGNYTSYTYYPPGSQFAGLTQSMVSSGNDAAVTLSTNYTSYDAMGRLTAWTNPQGNSFGSSYDAAGDLSSQSDGMSANGHPATGYSYDGLGRKVKIQYADGTTEQWHYDASGNVSQYTNRANNAQTYNAYDLRNRPTSWSWSDPSVTAGSAIYFDAVGRCTGVTNSVIQLSMAYDDSGALKTESMYFGTDGHTGTVSYAPDADGNVSTVTYPHGDIAWTPLDFAGRVGALNFAYGSSPNAFYGMATYGYTNAQLTSRATSYNVNSSYTFQANNRLETVDHHDNSNNSLSHQTYGYNPDGQMSWFLRTGNSTVNAFNNNTGDAYYYRADGMLSTVKYNALNPYSSTNFDGNNPAAATPGGVTRKDVYGYDAAGNRTSDQEGATLLTPTFDAENRQPGLGYDANGNTISAPYNGGSYTYTYNAYNQLISASGAGNSVTFVYDPKGRVVQRTINGTTSRQYYAGDQVVEEDDASNNKLHFYLYGAGGERAFRLDSTVYCYLYDGRGYLSHVTGPTGAVVEQYLYDASGGPKAYTPSGSQYLGPTSAITGGNRFLWSQGYEWFNEIGLYKCGARFYSPTLGRFMQPDPIGQAGGLNIYTHCGNDPINKSDPSGLSDLGTFTFNQNGPGFIPPDSGSEVSGSSTGGGTNFQSGSGSLRADPGNITSGSDPLQSNGPGTTSSGNLSASPSDALGLGIIHAGGNVFGGVGEALVDTAQGLKSLVMSVYEDPTGLRGLSRDFNTLYAMGSNPSATWAAVQADVVDNFKDAASTQHSIGYMGGLLIIDTLTDGLAGEGETTVFPKSAEEMENFLKVPGQRIPDGLTTPGRNKVVFRPNKDTKITVEQHPYDTNAPNWHRELHYHIDTPGLKPHTRYVPGDQIPGY